MACIDQDMWIATLCMERFLQSKEGPEATILKMPETEVHDAIGAHHFAAGTSCTASGADGFPLSAWGVLPTVGILVRAGRLIANGGKAEDRTQMLSAGLVAGLSASADHGLTFWRKTVKVGGKDVFVPAREGAGGRTCSWPFSWPCSMSCRS